MITLTYEELVEVFKQWNAEVVAEPDAHEMDFGKVDPDKQAKHFIATLADLNVKALS